MTIEFMLLAAPRSGTTWAANWLTTDTTLCLHDPLLQWAKEELDGIETPRLLGVSCTGLALFPEWVNAHPARKVVLHRDPREMDESLKKIGMTACSKHLEGVLEEIRGVHLHWEDLFSRPQYIYEYLLNRPFDPERWAVLKAMNVQPHHQAVTVNKAATAKLMAELRTH